MRPGDRKRPSPGRPDWQGWPGGRYLRGQSRYAAQGAGDRLQGTVPRTGARSLEEGRGQPELSDCGSRWRAIGGQDGECEHPLSLRRRSEGPRDRGRGRSSPRHPCQDRRSFRRQRPVEGRQREDGDRHPAGLLEQGRRGAMASRQALCLSRRRAAPAHIYRRRHDGRGRLRNTQGKGDHCRRRSRALFEGPILARGPGRGLSVPHETAPGPSRFPVGFQRFSE